MGPWVVLVLLTASQWSLCRFKLFLLVPWSLSGFNKMGFQEIEWFLACFLLGFGHIFNSAPVG